MNEAVRVQCHARLLWTDEDIKPTPRGLLECKTSDHRDLQVIVKPWQSENVKHQESVTSYSKCFKDPSQTPTPQTEIVVLQAGAQRSCSLICAPRSEMVPPDLHLGLLESWKCVGSLLQSVCSTKHPPQLPCDLGRARLLVDPVS